MSLKFLMFVMSLLHKKLAPQKISRILRNLYKKITFYYFSIHFFHLLRFNFSDESTQKTIQTYFSNTFSFTQKKKKRKTAKF